MLARRGLTEGPVEIPYPHSHHFNEEFDADERRLLSEWDWLRTPLLEKDRE